MIWVLRLTGTLVFLVLFGFAVVGYERPLHEASNLWAQPWDDVKAHSEGLCRRITKGKDDSFVVCMSIEHESHKLLQDTFGLPQPEAARLKSDCAEFEYFTPQLRCVRKRIGTETREN